MASVTVNDVRAPPTKTPWYKVLYVQVLIAIVLGALVGWLFPFFRQEPLDQGARRRLREADPDADRTHHLLHGRVRHLPYPGCPEGRAGRHQGPRLFRSRVDASPSCSASSSETWSGPARALAEPPDPAAVEQLSPSRPARRSRSTSFSTSSQTASSAPSPRAISFRFCSSPILFGFALHRPRRPGVTLRKRDRRDTHAIFGVIAIVMKVAPARRLRRDGLHDRQLRAAGSATCSG